MNVPSQKSFTCSICGATISKRASLQLENGSRVCRSHPEAQTAVQHKQDEELRRRETDPNKIRPPNGGLSVHRKNFFSELTHLINLNVVRPITATQQCDLWDHCWVCGKSGINRNDIPVLMLAATERIMRSNPEKILDCQARLQAAGLVDADILVQYSTFEDIRNMPIVLEYARGLHVNARMVITCHTCACSHGHKTDWEEAIKTIFGVGRPQPTAQLVAALGDAYEKSDLHQQIKELVDAEKQ